MVSFYGCKKKPKGPLLIVHTVLHDSNDTFSTSGVLVLVYDFDTGTLKTKGVTDENGDVQLQMDHGIYSVQAEYHTQDKSYSGEMDGWVEFKNKEIKKVTIDLYSH